MSKPAPITRETASEGALAAAAGHARRRLWLLEVIIALSMALLRAMNAGRTAGALPFQITAKAFVAISRVARLALRIHAETSRLLDSLKAGILPKAPRRRAATETDEAAETLVDHATLIDREPRGEWESDKAFRARLEALEALLDQDALAIGGEPREMAQRLGYALGFDPAWIGWLGDDWIDANLDLFPPAGGSTAEGREGGFRRHPPATSSRPVGGLRPEPAPVHPPPALGGSPPPSRAIA
jgi:hypothetical protein